MSFKIFVTLMLLLRCLGATGASFGLTEEPPQEGGVRAIAERTFVFFSITNIRLDITATNATLQFCAFGGLPSGSPHLVYGDVSPGADQTSLQGSIDVVDPNCVNFMRNPSFTLPGVLTRYELLLGDPATTSTVGRCVSTFAMTAKTTLLPCGLVESFTKVIWDDPTPIVYTDCIAEDSALEAEAVCYHSGDIWEGDFCFDITDEEGATINICMNGLTRSSAAAGAVSTKYLYYGHDAINNGAGKATLSLAMETRRPTYLRAIVRRAGIDDVPAGDPTVYDCPNNECVFDAYTRKYAKYEVCVEAMDGTKATHETATTTFTDMNLNAFDGGSQKSTLMEFVFANGLDGKTYSASYSLTEPEAGALGEAQPNAVNMDCTDVAPYSACVGYLDTGGDTGTAYLALSDPTGMNTIVTPHLIPSSQSLR